MRFFTIIVLWSLIFFSCNSGNLDSKLQETPKLNKTVSFEKLDSVKVNFIGNPFVHDIHPKSKTVLFLDSGPNAQTIILANFDGKIINSFSKFGDRPDSYGILLSSIRFLSENSFLVYGSKGFFTYNFEGKLLTHQKLKNYEMPDRTSNIMGYGMEKLGENYLYINQEFPANKDYSDKSFLYDLYLLKILHPESGEIQPIIQFPENSIFRNGKLFFRSAWDPAYDLGNGLIYIVFGLDPVIYTYNSSPPYELESSTPIKFKEFRNFKGTDSFTFEIEAFKDRDRSAFIENIKKIKEYFVIAYFPGYDFQDLEKSSENKSLDEEITFIKKVKKKYPYRIAIVDSLGNVINDFVPEGLEAKSMLVRNGELWMLEKSDEEIERDYFRLFRVGLNIESK